MLENMAGCSRDAATELERILTNFRVDELGANMEKLHAIEHQGDTQRHNVVEKLVKEFITPIEREDIMELTDQIDDVTDAVEDVLLKIYMYNIRSISEDAIAFVHIVGKCCTELLHVFEEFESFKKPQVLHESIIELNRLEEEGDALYINAVRKLHVSQADAKEVAAWTEIYSRMEKVCDTCEHVADLVEHIIMKNT
jgi:predicted phosphate transport protein (TIGR00153 family)